MIRSLYVGVREPRAASRSPAPYRLGVKGPAHIARQVLVEPNREFLDPDYRQAREFGGNT